jgi:crotonobetainyl-CoA:carnitine CoA-transferase CaiB-like acyl-CoA transferase
VPATKEAVAKAVLEWKADRLEQAIVDGGGCAAAMRALDEWSAHPQGRAVAREPFFHIETGSAGRDRNWTIAAERPLEGVRVLDLTRVLAGPVATRFLAGFGADVLRIDPPIWDEPAIVPEVTLGKRCARLDLATDRERETFTGLLRSADVLVHGHRPGALARRGFDSARVQELSPGLIEVSLDAYGWSGPWATRRGFDSLVQMSSGIAAEGMRQRESDRPVPLPVQALDHATGYLMAAAAVRGLTQRLTTGRGCVVRTSLARTAALLIKQTRRDETALPSETADDLAENAELTTWGRARRLKPPVAIAGSSMRWTLPPGPLGASQPRWF